MSLRAVIVALLALVAFCSQAHAQSARTWVSGLGDDANPCSRTAPCKTFYGAIQKTAAAGEINVIDSGDFRYSLVLTIDKSISIIAEDSTAGILVSGTDGIVINAASTSKIVLEGLDIDGQGSSTAGIRVLSAGTVLIRRSSIRNFGATGGNGIRIESPAATAVTVQDTSFFGNDIGVNALNSRVFLERINISRHRVAIAAAAKAIVRVSASSILSNNQALRVVGTGQIISFGNNAIADNLQAETPTQTLLLK